jgi:hypothetical protein
VGGCGRNPLAGVRLLPPAGVSLPALPRPARPRRGRAFEGAWPPARKYGPAVAKAAPAQQRAGTGHGGTHAPSMGHASRWLGARPPSRSKELAADTNRHRTDLPQLRDAESSDPTTPTRRPTPHRPAQYHAQADRALRTDMAL